MSADELPFDASLAGLFTRLGADSPRWDRAFGRRLAMALHEVADRVVFEDLDAVQLEGVAITLQLGKELVVVATGQRRGAPGEWTVRWRESELTEVPARIEARPRGEAILFCSVDASWRGRRGVLNQDFAGFAKGTALRARALATIGEKTEVRATVGDRDLSLAPELIAFEPPGRGEATLELLAAHQPVDATEADHRESTANLLRRDLGGALDAFARTTYVPGHLTASAFVLSADRSAVLLIWHRRLQRWLQPGGHIEPEDTDVIAAARREVAEETGIEGCIALRDGLFDVDVHAIPPRGGPSAEPGHLHYDLRIALIAPAGAAPQAGDGVSQARFFDLEALLESFDAAAATKSAATAPSQVPDPEAWPIATDASVLRAVRQLALAITDH